MGGEGSKFWDGWAGSGQALPEEGAGMQGGMQAAVVGHFLPGRQEVIMSAQMTLGLKITGRSLL